MSAFLALLAMSGLLALTSFGVGMLPLSFSYSRKHLSRLSSLGTGLLLGTALGVIIPEGIEVLAESSSQLPTGTIALSLLAGFSLMIVVEQLGSSHVHEAPSDHSLKPRHVVDDVSFDVELGELENEQGIPSRSRDASPRRGIVESDTKQPAYPLTVGLVIHGLADGLALGVSAVSSGDSSVSSDLSFLVFLALAIHKAPTALAYSTTLLSTSLPRVECKKHLFVFSCSTPVGAVVAYSVFAFLGIGQAHNVGIALLISGGSFLYVATVLQPVSHHASPEVSTEEEGNKSRIIFILLGMFIPYFIGSVLEHGHDHASTSSPALESPRT